MSRWDVIDSHYFSIHSHAPHLSHPFSFASLVFGFSDRRSFSALGPRTTEQGAHLTDQQHPFSRHYDPKALDDSFQNGLQ